MLNSKILRNTLKEIFGIDDAHLVPISTNWFLPTTDPDDHKSTWIGYRILSKKPYTRAAQFGQDMVKNIKVQFRITFVGKQAEDLADQVLLWEDRTDVQLAFEKSQSQINYQDRTSFTYPVRNGGYNDEMAWIVDLSVQTSYITDTKQHSWFGTN